jgi:hypothetical protein
MSKSATPKKKGPKHLNRLRVTENLISSYANLSENSREYVEHFLALQVYGDAGMGHYTPGSTRHRGESIDQHVMCECMEMTVYVPKTDNAADQRVSHTAIVENKRLGHALALIKVQQDRHFEAKVKTNSEKGQYQKRGRQIYGPDYIPKMPAKAATVAEPAAKKA